MIAAPLVLALVLAACSQALPVASPTGCPAALSTPLAKDRVQLLHTNDIHGHLDSEPVRSGASSFQQGGMATLASMVRCLRARAEDRTLLLDAGDAWQGTFISNANKGQAVTKVMSLMRYDAQALGNHDFDWGQDELRARASEATFPFLAANVRGTDVVTPYLLKEVGGVRFGIIGLTNPGSATIVKASSVAGLAFGGATETIRALLPEVRPKSDVVVVLSHIGVDGDLALAQDVPDIDVIVGGHSHTALRTARKVGRTTIVQTGAYTENLGRLELTVDPVTHRVTGATGADELVAVAAGQLKPDAEIAKLVDARRDEGKRYTARVVGRLAAPLDAPRAESGLGNLIADALLDHGRQQGWKTDVAFYNMGGVRAPLPAGEITYGQLYQVLPFGNTVVSVDLSGAQLREVLEATASSAGRLHVGGARYSYSMSRPAGQRLLSASVGGAPLDPARTYHVVTIDYLLTGGDGHTAFDKGTNKIYGDIEVDAVAAYMTARSPLDPKVDGRIDLR